MDECNTATELSKRITLKDAINWLNLSWTALDPTSIQRCFAKCGFMEASSSPVDDPLDEDDLPLALLGDVSWEDFVNMDKDTNTTSNIDANWEEQLVAKASGANIESEEDSGEEVEVEDDPKYISMKEALVQLKKIIDACYHAQQPQLIETASKLEAQITEYRLKQSCKTTQKNIRDFFMT
jgi:hypothetical protein